MSYSRKNCRNVFSQQQINKMNYTLNHSRSFLLKNIVELDQKDINGKSFGQMAYWDSDKWNNIIVPEFFNWEEGENKWIKSDCNVYNNNQKYHDWNSNESILNFKNFTITSNLKIKSYFKDI